MDWTTGVFSLAGARDFSSSLWVHTSLGAHQASYLIVIGGLFFGHKVQVGCDVNHSPLSNAEVKNELELYFLLT
jgi:hypothetical protein